MRVIAGRCAGARLAAPPGNATRPLTDRVKEALFGILEPRLVGASVVDLYAGSGAVGIEALSRGAERATFVERDAGAAATIRANLARTGLASAAVVMVADVERFLAGADDERFTVAIADPPYAERLPERLMERMVGRVAPDGVVVVKHFWRTPPPDVPGTEVARRRRFGETALTFVRRLAEEDR